MTRLVIIASIFLQTAGAVELFAQTLALPSTSGNQSKPTEYAGGMLESRETIEVVETIEAVEAAEFEGLLKPPRTDDSLELPLVDAPSLGSHDEMAVPPEPAGFKGPDFTGSEFAEPDSASSPMQRSSVCDGLCRSGCPNCQLASSVGNYWSPLPKLNRLVRRLRLQRFTPAARFRARRRFDRGIGYERVMFAPQVLDTAIQPSHLGIRYQLDYGLNRPDRSEFFWSAAAGANGGDGRVDVQDVTLRMALGTEKLMALTQYTLRSLDPLTAANTTGMGDLAVGVQALMVDGKRTKIASLFRTHFATGPADRGLGRGHTVLEHGLLMRHCLSAETYLFGEAKYWLPISGTSGRAGDVLQTGWGISTIASESDVFAFLPTFEVRTFTFLFGGQTVGGSQVDVDGVTAVELYPGARFVLGPQSDLGLWEFGVGVGTTVSDRQWFDTRWVFDLRFSH